MEKANQPKTGGVYAASDLVADVKSRKFQGLEHASRMDQTRVDKESFETKPESGQGQTEMAGRSKEWFTRAEREGKNAEGK